MSVEGWTGRIHPAAELFPMMSGEDFDALVDSIKAQGLREPVWLTSDGELLDGRNRVAACNKAGIPVVTRTYHGEDPVSFVMALNMDRRHLTVGQRAALALKLVPMFEEEGRRAKAAAARTSSPRRPAQPKDVADLPHLSMLRDDAPTQKPAKSRDRAGKAAKVSGRAVAQAKRLSESAPDLLEQVESGELALDRAERILRDRQAEQRRKLEAESQRQHLEVGTRVDILAGDFRDVLSDLTNVDAIITDPPYPREFIPLLSDLAVWADKVLAPDGVLAVLMGQTYLPEVYERLSVGRPYRWTACYLTSGPGYASHQRRVQSNWKPLLVYGGGQRLADVVRTEGSDANAKALHHWGQDYGAFHQIVERLTLAGQTVVDPFMGSGTTLAAAKALGRHGIGCDVDADHVQTARERLGVA